MIELDSTNGFSTDRPLDDPADDILNRNNYCMTVAATLGNWKEKESLVVGIEGEWGAGKTTVKNFIVHHLRNLDRPPHVVEYNPWQWSGQDRILESFATTVTSSLKNSVFHRCLRKLSQFLLFGSTVGKSAIQIGKDIPLTLVSFFGIVGIYNGWPGWVQSTIFVAILLIVIVSDIADRNLRNRLLENTKERLRKKTKKLNRPIVVFIDDIDRLTKQEIRLVLQLVKANLNIPNMIFVLLFDRKVVQDALKEDTLDLSSQFLSKIVQVELEIPKTSRQELLDLLTTGINNVVSRTELKWDPDRWASLYLTCIFPYFTTVRDVKRFIGSFDFYFDMHENEGHLEVNPVDLILIEVLRMFDYQSYKRISGFSFPDQSNSRFIVHGSDGHFWEEQFESVLQEHDADTRKRTEDILHGLFPQVRQPHGAQEWKRDLRICDPMHFNMYFEVSLDSMRLTVYQMYRRISTGSIQTIQNVLREALEGNTIRSLLEYLIAAKDGIEEIQLQYLVTALFNCGDMFPNVRTTFAQLSIFELCRNFVHMRLKVLGPAESTKILRQAFNDSDGIVLPLVLFDLEDQPASVYEDHQNRLVRDDSVAEFKQMVLARIRGKAATSSLPDNSGLSTVLHYWRLYCGTEEETREWYRGLSDSPEMVTRVLRHIVGTRLVGGIGVRPVVWGRNIDNIIPLEDIVASFAAVPPKMLSESDVTHMGLLREALTRKSLGGDYTEIRPEGE
ncbi:MAG: hypothetical protein BGO89_07085 [Candidatus Kapaibacterium thiocyanatum]|uniref:KAP NTPase domain-containing protein n=1 Tax=Candidatus Kapaibacterium thiocyanatum TaxID=1895771 RepID=A0A1M3KZ19_9BACT|nr:MAG: hypothetical protein BGO89_07085 ['Candidatus Kapabacteria' thiocyanatum]